MRGTSSDDVGIPPRIAPSGANGPTAFLPDTTIPAVDRPVGIGEAVADPIVNKSDEDVPVGSFSNLPAASPTSAPATCCGLEVDGVGVAVAETVTVA